MAAAAGQRRRLWSRERGWITNGSAIPVSSLPHLPRHDESGAGRNSDVDDCVRIIDASLDQGVNFIDTANRYNWASPRRSSGKLLRGKRDNVVLATKVFTPGANGVPTAAPRRHIMPQVEESLRRMGTDWIDLTNSTATTRTC